MDALVHPPTLSLAYQGTSEMSAVVLFFIQKNLQLLYRKAGICRTFWKSSS